MRSEHIEQIIDEAVYKVVWKAEYVPGSMMQDDWDALEMLKFELMAIAARKTYGINLPVE